MRILTVVPLRHGNHPATFWRAPTKRVLRGNHVAGALWAISPDCWSPTVTIEGSEPFRIVEIDPNVILGRALRVLATRRPPERPGSVRRALMVRRFQAEPTKVRTRDLRRRCLGWCPRHPPRGGNRGDARTSRFRVTRWLVFWAPPPFRRLFDSFDFPIPGFVPAWLSVKIPKQARAPPRL